MQKVVTRVAGQQWELTPEQIRQAAEGLDPEPLRTYYVVVNDRRYPPKQIVAAVTGLDRGDFITTQARSLLRRLGFTVGRLHHDPLPPPPDSPTDRVEREAAPLKPFRGRWVAIQGVNEVLFDAERPEDVLAWLRKHGVRADGFFRVPIDPTVDIGGFAS